MAALRFFDPAGRTVTRALLIADVKGEILLHDAVPLEEVMQSCKPMSWLELAPGYTLVQKTIQGKGLFLTCVWLPDIDGKHEWINVSRAYTKRMARMIDLHRNMEGGHYNAVLRGIAIHAHYKKYAR